MEKFSVILESIDWVFAAVILIGGRYFGTKFFRLSTRESLNFLGFATAFGVLYLIIIYFTKGIGKNQVANLFITYLVVTSFYELLAQRVFEWIEGFGGKKKETPLPEAIEKYESATGEKVTEIPKGVHKP
jgi:FtsH-binding integral membrane protein